MSLQQQPQNDGNWEWIVDDDLGSVLGVVNSAATPLESHTYSPFGEPTQTRQTAFGFTDEMTDANDLVYLRERYYDPVLGRFLNLDPIEGTMEQPQSLNRYSYVQNNPVNLTDPSGLCASNDLACQTAVSCLERDFPSAYVFWDNRPATLPLCSSPTATQLPSPTPCPTPNQPNVTMTPTPRVTVTPVGAKRFSGMPWEADAITTLHEGIKLLQQARSNLPLFNVVLARADLPDLKSGTRSTPVPAQTFHRNDNLHPAGAELTTYFSYFWNDQRKSDQAYGRWIVVHELNHGMLYTHGVPSYADTARNSKQAFIGSGRGVPEARYPTQYAFINRENTDNPEYLVDAMTGLVWDQTHAAIPTTVPEIYAAPSTTPPGGIPYPYNVSDITSIDGNRTPLETWIRSNVPGFLP